MSLSVSLMPHQKEAVNKLSNGSILCGGVGTGKSMTALAYYYFIVCRGVWLNECVLGALIKPTPLYIITTARKRDTGEWLQEMERFGLERGGENQVDYVIDSWNNLHKYVDVRNAFFIFDEQRVVGKGQWVKSFLKIVRRNQWILLSATPGDTWEDYIPVFIANGFYHNRSEFLREHAVFNPYITKFPKIDKWIEVGKLERLRRQITVDMKYDRKTTRHWKTILDGGERGPHYDVAMYNKVAKDRWDPWKNEPIQDIAGACFLMRKVCNSNPKRAESVLWLTLNSRTQRAIVFYNYDYELDLIKEVITDQLEELCDESVVYRNSEMLQIAEWNGHKHDPIPDSSSWIYLVQYNAGAEGWNCTETDTIIFYSRSYSYKMTEQAAGRIDRLNTEFEDLYYYVLTTDSPIDKAIERTLKEKKTFNEKRFWAIDIENDGGSFDSKKKMSGKIGSSMWNGYLPVVKCEGVSYKISAPRPFETMKEALKQIADWKSERDGNLGEPIYKAWIEVYKNDKLLRTEEVGV